MLPYGVLSLQAEEEAGGEVFHIVHTVDVLTVTIEITWAKEIIGNFSASLWEKNHYVL